MSQQYKLYLTAKYHGLEKLMIASVGFVITLLNLLAMIVMLMPFLFVYTNGKLRRKTKHRTAEVSETKNDLNKALAEELFLARNCAFIAILLLILGNLLLLTQLEGL
jgi:ABC-type transport system involved in cytochrome bd biosynthesis fused ATPase/permease subunit